MQVFKTIWPALLSVALVSVLLPSTKASAVVVQSEPAADRVDSKQDVPLLSSRALPEPGREVRLQAYLYRLADTLADAYADRRELPGNRFERLSRLAAAVERAATASSLPQTLDWRYAAMLLWIAHRETRLCHAPRLLGTEDNGRAHGYWQVWDWKHRDPFSADTAMDMLIKNPGAWYLPSLPWTGYPDAARFLEEHPFR
jgi:hypothetical protein